MMGAHNQFGFVSEIDKKCIDDEFVHVVRLVVATAGDGTGGGDPYHNFIDVHSVWDDENGKWVRQDVPITDKDRAAVRMIQRLSRMCDGVAPEVAETLGMAMYWVCVSTWGRDIADEIRSVATNGGEWAGGLAVLVMLESERAKALGVAP